MKLFYSTASCSLASNIALHEAEITYELTRVDLETHKTEDGANFFTIHDKGYVPYLILDNSEGLSEGVVILQYIADQKPQTKLAAAEGTMERYRLQEWLTYINSELHKTMSVLFDRTKSDQTKDQAIVKVGKLLDWISTKLDGNSYVMGDVFTIADCYLFTVLNWGQWIKIDITQWPVLHSYMCRVSARPKVQEALKKVGLIA